MKFTNNDIAYLFKLFKGREDVFALRWEKGNKSGYTPAYRYDPYHYRLHKANGGTFQSYSHKTYLPLSEMEIIKHLKGLQQIGIYPLLQDNTSWFLVADFDKSDWQQQALKFLEVCTAKNIPAYLERSRSGNGAYIWISLRALIQQPKVVSYLSISWKDAVHSRHLIKAPALTVCFQIKITCPAKA